jgi:FMN phosphatase YigB (HAD superfamily)
MSKTIICDVDGTLVKHMMKGHLGIMEIPHEVLPGVVEKFREWEAKGHKIILITGRRESVRERTESELCRLGIPFDMLLMGYADSGRILINDIGSSGNMKCHAIPVVRDRGWKSINWGVCEL